MRKNIWNHKAVMFNWRKLLDKTNADYSKYKLDGKDTLINILWILITVNFFLYKSNNNFSESYVSLIFTCNFSIDKIIILQLF